MQPDYFIERQKLKKKITYFKATCVILIALLITFGKALLTNQTDLSSMLFLRPTSYIGSVQIEGMILENKQREKSIEEIAKNQNIKALIVHINSPGGSMGGSEQLYQALRKVGDTKPIVAIMGGMAASGGYMTAIAADYIVASPSSITGSIGVVWQNFEISSLAEKLGITFNAFKSGPLKAAPNWFEKVTPEAEEAAMSLIRDNHNYFIELISKRRKLSQEEILKVSDGRAYTGRQAYNLKLVDTIGNKSDALKWLHEEKKIDSTLKVIDLNLVPTSFVMKLLNLDLKVSLLNFLHSSSGLFALAL